MHLKQVKVGDLCSTHENKPHPIFFGPDHPSDGDNIQDRPNTKILFKHVKDFTEKTSCHGVSRIADPQAPNNWVRWKNILWLMLTLTGLVMACLGLVEIMDDYLSYPTSTSITLDYVPRAEFPSVTFCNLNLVIPDRLPNYSSYEKVWTTLSLTDASYLEEEVRMDQLIFAFGSLSTQEKKAYGHNIEEMMVDCTYGGDPCSVSDFFWTYNQKYGNCYSFNFGFDSNGTEQAIRRVKSTGKGGGLSLTLDIQSDLYLNMTKEIGIIMMVHEAGVFPTMQELGMTVAPGYVTSLGLTQEETVMAEPPYGICVPAESDGNKNVNFFASSGFVYTYKVCQRSCEQAQIIHACGCCDRNIPCNPDGLPEAFGITFQDAGNISICDGSDWKTSVCISNALIGSVGACAGSKCYPECKTLSYATKQSFALWPNKRRTDGIFNQINGSARLANVENDIDASKNISNEQQYDFIRNTVLKLDVHYVSLSKTVTGSEPTYTWNLLLSNVGGQLGLWLGFSLLTAFEFVELFFDVVVFGIKMICQRVRFFHCLKTT